MQDPWRVKFRINSQNGLQSLNITVVCYKEAKIMVYSHIYSMLLIRSLHHSNNVQAFLVECYSTLIISQVKSTRGAFK